MRARLPGDDILRGIRVLLLCWLALTGQAAIASDQTPTNPAVSPAQAQLRHVIGRWDVVTTTYDADGSVAGSFPGTYSFAWVVPDQVVSGVSKIPAWNATSAILFYLRPANRQIEMVSVGQDGQRWIMTGADDAEVRETASVPMSDGTTLKLRFTRFNITADRFESKMERSTDGGASWQIGNHQLFTRRVDGTAALSVLRPLAGHCWKGRFPAVDAYDLMCVEEMPGGTLRARHVVRSAEDGPYSGETLYFRDPADRTAHFAYFTSLGDLQRGQLRIDGADLHFENIRHVTRDGAMLTFRATARWLPDGSYQLTSSQQRGDAWSDPITVIMRKIDCVGWDAVMQGCG